ncbi:hypothetical protein ZWY2020_052389 [Hordeum vulgare]|nr:hypothetical protein ZWY2020_052389 [Hordeum vulgare]
MLPSRSVTTMESIAAIAVATSADEDTETTIPRTVVAVILGGGAGTRLFPLTKRRAADGSGSNSEAWIGGKDVVSRMQNLKT